MARHTESKSQQAFIRWWDLAYRSLGVPDKRLLFAIPNGGARNCVTGAILKAEGVRRGVPDLFLAVPRVGKCDEWIADDLPKVTLKQFHGLFLEFKTWMGRVTEDQQQIQAVLRDQNYVTAVVRGFDQAQRAITAYLRGEEVHNG